MTCRGYLPGTLIYQGAITAEIFMDWLEYTVLPQLEPGTVLVMDNASIHRVHGIEELMERFNVFLEYLPPYSPDFNPIETSFAALKRWIRRHASTIPEYEDFDEFLKVAIESLDSSKALNWFWHSGYRSQ
jgi:transposase